MLRRSKHVKKRKIKGKINDLQYIILFRQRYFTRILFGRFNISIIMLLYNCYETVQSNT